MRTGFFQVAIIALLTLAGKSVKAQAVAAASGARLGVYGTANVTDLGVKSDRGIGFSLGGYLQSSHIFGLEVRGTMTKWYVNYPQYTAVGGVRAAFHQGRLTEYGFVGGGAGRARYVVYPYATSSTGGAIQLAGGADFNIKDSRFAWRIVDFSYSRFFVGPGLNSFSGSTGLVYHF